LLALAAAGCRDRGPTELVIEKAPAVSAAAQAAAERLYTERCAQCHGARGGGDGLMAQSVRPRPQRLADRMWQANVSNARLRKVVVYGGGAVNKSNMMPPSPDLASQPEVVDGLVALIRSFAPAS
jgi:mono/diheme cytochrome c family protein